MAISSTPEYSADYLGNGLSEPAVMERSGNPDSAECGWLHPVVFSNGKGNALPCIEKPEPRNGDGRLFRSEVLFISPLQSFSAHHLWATDLKYCMWSKAEFPSNFYIPRTKHTNLPVFKASVLIFKGSSLSPEWALQCSEERAPRLCITRQSSAGFIFSWVVRTIRVLILFLVITKFQYWIQLSSISGILIYSY